MATSDSSTKPADLAEAGAAGIGVVRQIR